MNFNNGFRITGINRVNGAFGIPALNSNGDTILVGSSTHDTAVIYTGSGTNWTKASTLSGNYGGIYIPALNGAGNIAILGQYNATFNVDGSNLQVGAVYVFTGTNNNWSQAATITGSERFASYPIGERFASSLAINKIGNIIIVGAPFTPGSYNGIGSAYIFTGSGNNWIQTKKITASDGNIGNEFGRFVSLNADGNIAAISARDSAYIFTGSGNNWLQTAKLTGLAGINRPGGAYLNALGNVVFAKSSEEVKGSVIVFTGSNNNWNKVATITGNDTQNYDNFGMSIAVNSYGNIIIVGAPRQNSNFISNNGAGYVFSGDNTFTNWTQITKIAFSDSALSNAAPELGEHVAINREGNILALQSTPNLVGSTYIFTEKSNQTITFSPISNKTFGDAPFSLTATASSNLAVSYTSSNTSVATVAGNVVTIVGVGTTTITASQTGDSNYNAATPISQTLAVNKANQTITFNALASKIFGDAPFSLTATASSNLGVSYTSSNTSVATVAGNVVTIVGVGTTTITASQVGDSNYNAATPISQTLTVNKADQTITFPSISTKTFGDVPFALTATASSNLGVSYTSSNTSVATVAGNVVTIVGVGTTTITASQVGDSNYNAATPVSQTLAVNKASQTITFPEIPTINLSTTTIYNLNATSNNNEIPITYTSSNLSSATISNNTLNIIGVGTVTVTASQIETQNYSAAAVSRTFEIVTIRNPKILKVSNLPNGVYYDENTQSLYGNITDEGNYHVKIYIQEANTICEKTIKLMVYNPDKRYIYKINYPMNVGFIKYNAPERIGLKPYIEVYKHPTYGDILRHSEYGTIYAYTGDGLI